MKTMAYKKLMDAVDDGRAQINAWAKDGDQDIADVTFYGKRQNYLAKRYEVKVTGTPE